MNLGAQGQVDSLKALLAKNQLLKEDDRLCELVLITGLFFRVGLLPLVFTMLVAVLKVHLDSFEDMQLALTLGVMVTGLIMTGPGRFAVDMRKGS